MNTMHVVIGDWTDDGHGKKETVTIESNKSVSELQKAYKKSCKLTKLAFDSDGGFAKEKLQICTESEENYLTPETIVILEKFKCPLLPAMKKEEYRFWDPDMFVKLLMWFIGLSIKDMKWNSTEDKIPVLNGYWGKLNVQFGYGLFIH